MKSQTVVVFWIQAAMKLQSTVGFNDQRLNDEWVVRRIRRGRIFVKSQTAMVFWIQMRTNLQSVVGFNS